MLNKRRTPNGGGYVKSVVFTYNNCIVIPVNYENHVNAPICFDPLPFLLFPVRLYIFNMAVSLFCHLPTYLPIYLSSYYLFFSQPYALQLVIFPQCIPITFIWETSLPTFFTYFLNFPFYSCLCTTTTLTHKLYLSAYRLFALNQPFNNSGILPGILFLSSLLCTTTLAHKLYLPSYSLFAFLTLVPVNHAMSCIK